MTLKLDRRDREILRLMQEDSSHTVAELARRLEMSPPGLQKRLRKLEEGGVLLRQVALVDREAVELDLLCFVQVTLAHHQPDAVEGFRHAMRSLPEVLECHMLTGEFDYLLKVVARNHHDLEAFLVERLTPVVGVDKIRTSIVLNEIKSSTALPLGDDEE
ncbi:MAG TPA: Lrp/AsnC family transcriptional regulator [Thermoanaerobaculia bacterium]|nr:Lrp/AsnC family transcriptional regulator [Thermoanaerobaculia bacterium]